MRKKKYEIQYSMSFEEIGKAMGITSQAAGQQYKRAIKKVREQFKKLNINYVDYL